MGEAVGTAIGGLMAALLFSVLARVAWRIGGLLGVAAALVLWCLWGIALWQLLLTLAALVGRAGR
jgi:uncharacterized membrane protein YgaE (UPF0421/DUF939 family)